MGAERGTWGEAEKGAGDEAVEADKGVEEEAEQGTDEEAEEGAEEEVESPYLHLSSTSSHWSAFPASSQFIRDVSIIKCSPFVYIKSGSWQKLPPHESTTATTRTGPIKQARAAQTKTNHTESNPAPLHYSVQPFGVHYKAHIHDLHISTPANHCKHRVAPAHPGGIGPTRTYPTIGKGCDGLLIPRLCSSFCFCCCDPQLWEGFTLD